MLKDTLGRRIFVDGFKKRKWKKSLKNI
jgi:hypothetical protein